MANKHQLAQRLQLALNMQGLDVSLTEKTFYSIKYQRVMTKYKLKRGRELILSTYSLVEVIKAMAAMLQEVRANGN